MDLRMKNPSHKGLARKPPRACVRDHHRRRDHHACAHGHDVARARSRAEPTTAHPSRRPEHARTQRTAPGPAAHPRTHAALRWLPTTCLAAFTVTVLIHYGVSVTDLTRFTAYLLLGLTLPGTLLIRVTYRGERTLAEELALGTALGYALEALTYIAARTTATPLLVLAWPLATYALFLAVPRLRKHWKGRPHPRPPPGGHGHWP
ncbi:hypothetical protein ACFQX6_63000 [Streptosporangium lutulentum]